MELTAEDILKEREEITKRIDKPSPPKNGLCRRCGQDKPINRLMLCYRCWVIVELEDKGWKEGQSHPGWCHCELGVHTNNDGTNRSYN